MFVDSIALLLTNRCNLACAYCYERDKSLLRMPFETAKDAVDWVLRDEVSGPAKSIKVTLFGGEPFLEMETIKQIVAYSRRRSSEIGKQVEFTTTTNGILFTREVAEYWKDNRLGVLLSCDGIAVAHDMHRKFPNGKGSYTLVEKHIDNILYASEGKEVRMTFLPRTVPFLAEGVKYLHQRGFRSISVFPAEECVWNDQSLVECEAKFYEIGEMLVSALENNCILKVNPVENHIITLLSDKEGFLNDGMCGAGRQYVAIGADGTIYPCHRFASSHGFKGAFPLGTIYSGIKEQAQAPFLRVKKKLLLGCDIECGRCDLYGKCGGGCIAANYEVTGHLMMRAPFMRFHEKIWYNIASSIIEYFQNNHCEVFEKNYIHRVNKSFPRTDSLKGTAPLKSSRRGKANI